MDLNQLKNSIQNAAIDDWVNIARKKGTVESITGSGKTFIFLKALYTMPKGEKDTVHLFLAETNERQKDLYVQIQKFNYVFKVDVMEDYNLQFHCYQTAYKWQKKKFGLVCCDEIHDQLSPAYVMFHLNNKYDAILGLSAKINEYSHYSLKRYPDLQMFFGKPMVTKIDIIDLIAPIFFRYTVNDGQADGTSRKLNIYVIKNTLDSKYRNVQAGNAKKHFFQTESEAYGYATTMFNKAISLEQGEKENIYEYEERKNVAVKRALYHRNKLLYNLYSKRQLVERIILSLKGKTIIFGNDIGSLEAITPGRVISSRNSDERNALIRKTFEDGRLRTIGSFKKLKQGANLDDVDNCIIKDYYSSEIDFIQRIGRLRENKGKIGHVFVIVTENTQEVTWFNKMVENSTEYNFILCDNLKMAMDEYSKSEVQ